MQKNTSKEMTIGHKILSIFISGLASTLLTPILACFALLVMTIRFLVTVFLWMTSNGKIKLIDSMDSFQVFDKPNNSLETYTFLVLEGEADISKIRRAILDQVIHNSDNLYEKLKCKIVKKCGFYCWENTGPSFDISNHVKILACDLHPKKVWMEEEVLQRLSEMYSNPIPINLPRWELVIVPNFIYTGTKLDGPGTKYYAVIFRIHHSISDGISVTFFLSHALGDFPVETAINPLKPLINVTFFSRISNYIKLFIMWPKLLYENMGVEPEKNCFHGPELSSSKIVAWTRPIEMDTVKKIRKISKCSTISVLNSAVGGAFCKLAQEKDSVVPIKLTAVTSIPMLPYPNLKPQNRFSGAFFPLRIGNCSRASRIRSTEKTVKELVGSGLILMNSLLLRFVGILPASMSQNMTDSRELTCLTSNIPGPVKPAYIFGGDRLVDVAGWLPIKNKTGNSLIH